MAIEERARKAVSEMNFPFFSQPYEDLEKTYIQGASDQHKIDIDKAWNWIKGVSKVMLDCDISCYEVEFRKAMEEK